FMGLWATRTDEITGGESVELYHTYLKTGKKELESLILLHNRDDLLQLTRLLAITEKIDLHKIMFFNGFPVFQNGKIGYIEKIKPTKYYTALFGTLKPMPMDYKWFSDHYEVTITACNGAFSIKLMDLPQSKLLDGDGHINYGYANSALLAVFKEILSKL
ncbi:MAG: ribonuclease H-like domain-containing protein, partial [Anaerovorax sp.]